MAQTQTGDSDATGNGTCPWCGEKISELWEIERQGDVVRSDCGWCEKPIDIYLVVSHHYTVRKVKKDGSISR